MRTQPRTEDFEQTIEIAAPPSEVWRTITDPERIVRWMNRARVESSWQVGSEIALLVELEGHTYRDRGTILAVEPERLLRFEHWSAVSRVPDTPETRTVMSYALAAAPIGTRLTFRHERLRTGTNAKHARFFWSVALLVLKDVAEGREGIPAR